VFDGRPSITALYEQFTGSRMQLADDLGIVPLKLTPKHVGQEAMVSIRTRVAFCRYDEEVMISQARKDPG
jgi:hypothetical protein